MTKQQAIELFLYIANERELSLDDLIAHVNKMQAEEDAAYFAPYSGSFTRGIKVEDIQRPSPDKFPDGFFDTGGRFMVVNKPIRCAFFNSDDMIRVLRNIQRYSEHTFRKH